MAKYFQYTILAIDNNVSRSVPRELARLFSLQIYIHKEHFNNCIDSKTGTQNIDSNIQTMIY